MQLYKKVHFVTRDDALVARAEQILAQANLSLLRSSTHQEIEREVTRQVPPLVLLDAEIGERETIETCSTLRQSAGMTEMAILVLVATMDDENMVALLNAGADDVVGRELKPLSFKARVSSHLRRIATARDLARNVHDSEVLIDITSTLIAPSDIMEGLYRTATLIAAELTVERCSVVLVRPEGDYGLVIASSDDPEMRSLPINLNRYPEITRAAEQQSPLIIDNVEQSALLRHVLPNLKDVGVKSVALFPITREDQTVGVIFLRFFNKREKFVRREMVFCQTVANAAAIALRNVEIVEMLKAKTLEVEKVQLEAESKLLRLQRYEEFFKSAADGMVVLEQSQKMIFANPEAAVILGMAEAELHGRPFADCLSPSEVGRFERLLDEFTHGKVRRRVDFNIRGDAPRDQIVSISAASLLDEEGMTLLIMRDVTEERMVARRLVEAQKRLVEGEKRMAMVEVAGTAAHELNNPLTSIFTSLAMARRQMRVDEKIEERILDNIEKETDRMASIIRRLSKITEYSTTSYVGDARIIDLEKACPVDPDEER